MNTRSIINGVDKHTHVPKDKLIINPPFPDSIKIEITSRCNYKCPYCLTWKTKRETGDIDRKFLYRIFKEAHNVGVKEIGMFLLGESFLVKDLPDYIKYAKEEVGIEYVFLTTNGSLCSPKRTIDIINSGLDSLKFSINAGTREGYKEMHGVDLFDKVIKNIKWLHQYKKDNNLVKPRTCISSILIDSKKQEMDDFKKQIEQYVDEFYYLPLYNQAGHVGGKEYTKIVGNIGRADNAVNPIPCWTLFNSAKISWNGWLIACCFDHDERFQISDLNKVSLLEAWNNPKFVELRKKHLENKNLDKSECSKCLGY